MRSSHPYFAGETRRPLLIAHRGGCGLWPENTLFAFRQAVHLGADILETDLHATADGNLVLIHDDTVDRTTDGSGKVNRMTVSDLQNLDAGYRWSADGGKTFPFRGKGLTIPTLEELLRDIPHIRVNIDIKERERSVAAELCRMIRDFGKEHRVMVASFDSVTLTGFRSACSGVATSASEREVKAFFYRSRLPFAGRRQYPFYALQVPQYSARTLVVTDRFINAAHRCGLPVHAWPDNQTDGLSALMRMGIDGIITDFPDRVVSLRDATDQAEQDGRLS